MEDMAMTNTLMDESSNSRGETSAAFDSTITYGGNRSKSNLKKQQLQQQQQQQQLLLQRQQRLQHLQQQEENGEQQILNARHLTTVAEAHNGGNNIKRKQSDYQMDTLGASGMSMHSRSGSFKVSPNSLTTVSEVPPGSSNGSNSQLNRGMSLHGGPRPQSGISPARPTSLASSADNVRKDPPSAQTAPATDSKPPVRITSRIVFLKVGQVDTRNERYDAEAYIECFWEDDQIFKILSDPNMAKNGKSQYILGRI
jgi:hypothetical protein